MSSKEFKDGDMVKVISYQNEYQWEKDYGINIGDVVEIVSVNHNDYGVVSKTGKTVFVFEENLELVSKGEGTQGQTPYQKKGYTENSLFKYIGEDGNFERGEVIKLHNDDGSDIPDFKSVTRDRCRYCFLDSDVKYIGEDGCEDMLLVEDMLSDTGNEQPPKDNVNSPSHYKTGKIECIVAMEAMLSPEEFIGYLRGNIFKYTYRYKDKNGLEDLKKAQWYLNKLIEKEAEKDGNHG